jgi:ribosomal 30S subunit maturation factor RimM
LNLRARLVSVGRVGAPHGRDGSFWVERALTAAAAPESSPDPLAPTTEVTVAGRRARVERREGSPERPLVRLFGVGDRAAAAALRGEALLVSEAQAPLEPGEWLVEDLLGARVDGLGEVTRVLSGPSCDLLEVGTEATLVPLVSDAIHRVDAAARTIEVDLEFLGLGEDPRG